MLSNMQPGFQEQKGVSRCRLPPVINMSVRGGMQRGNHPGRQTGRESTFRVEQRRRKTVGKETKGRTLCLDRK